MSHWKKSIHESEVTISPKTRVPLYVVSSSMFLAAYLTGWGMRLEYDLKDKISRDQLQMMINQGREQNREAYPAFRWPDVPPKQAAINPIPIPNLIVTK